MPIITFQVLLIVGTRTLVNVALLSACNVASGRKHSKWLMKKSRKAKAKNLDVKFEKCI